MVGSSKCDFRLSRGQVAKPPMPAMIASSKCDFSLMAEGLSVMREAAGASSRIGLSERFGSIAASSSKCDFKFSIDDRLDRFSLTARVAGSSKCDFSVLVDFGIRGGRGIRAAAGGSSKCDFELSRFEAVSNPERIK